MFRYLFFKLCGLFIFSFGLNAQFSQVQISVFYSLNITSFVFTPVRGNYILEANQKITNLKNKEPIYFSLLDKSIQILDGKRIIGTYDAINIRSKSLDGYFKIQPLQQNQKERYYNDELQLKAKKGYIELVNILDLENYIIGVVESEAGQSASSEFYKTQAILSRTYAFLHLNKHEKEGFNLCDEVHCQAYKGKSNRNKVIQEAVNQTGGLIISDSSFSPILSVYHSNSGGLTANSEDVWNEKLPYLRSVSDTFSLLGKNVKWERNIAVNEWNKFLQVQGINVVDKHSNNYKLNSQSTRQKYFYINGDSITMSLIRNRFNLRSNWFVVEAHGEKVAFKGKGYGHGVGLSQEGAMEMAKKGFSYEEIINYYYTDIQIISISEIGEKDKSNLQ
ncbi:SpoIID/LytB domain-containing protein [Bacteroidota bacterium]